MTEDDFSVLVAQVNLLTVAVTAIFESHPDKAALRRVYTVLSEQVVTHHLFLDRSEKARTILDQLHASLLSKLQDHQG